MARIKFLDILEETKQKPVFRSEEQHSERETHGEQQRAVPKEPYRDFRGESPTYEYRTPSLPRESRLPQSFSSRKNAGRFGFESSEKEDALNSKLIWIAALVLFLSALFFFGGYWAARLQQKMEVPEIPAATFMPTPEMIDPAPIPEPVRVEAPKKIPVVQPLTANPVKKPAPRPKTAVGGGEYVVQVAAFTQLDKARDYERRLSEALNGGENVYISENYMGQGTEEKKIFRVRVRKGFRSESEAKSVLGSISSALGVNTSDLRIIRLD